MITHMNWVEIDHSALIHNLDQLAGRVGRGVGLMPVVKSNAYGHGMIPIAKICAQHSQVAFLGVANTQEALELRRSITTPIFVLSYYGPEDIARCAGKNIHLPLYSKKQLEVLRKFRKPIPVHIKVDIGTSRIGVLPKNLVAFCRELPKSVFVAGVFSHFASSEDSSSRYTSTQLHRFQAACRAVSRFRKITWQHVACSAALARYPEARGNLVRAGLMTYGLWPSESTQKLCRDLDLQPVLSWKTRLIQVKEVMAGTGIGYGQTTIVKRKTRLGVLAAGYYEGYRRLFSRKAFVIIHGRRAKILGNICMNMSMVDLRNIPEAQEGDEAILLGRSGNSVIAAEYLARFAKTINYEVVTQIHPQLPRLVV